MDKAFGFVYDRNTKRYKAIDLEFDLKSNEANIVGSKDIGDSRSRALFEAEKMIGLYLSNLDITKGDKDVE
jgi:hypothetical protein